MDKNKRLDIGIIGFGSFGKLMSFHLSRFHNIYVYDEYYTYTEELPDNVHISDLNTVLKNKVVIISVTMETFESVAKTICNKLAPGTLVVEVTSVKIRPLAILKQHLHEDIDILGTHPLFGPESTKDGIKGRKIVLFPVRCKDIQCIKQFISEKLELQILLSTPEEHDKQMAQVQALSHFIGQALKKMDIPEHAQATATYRHLLAVKDIVMNDSEALFNTIQNENPYAAKVREKFLKAILETNEKLKVKNEINGKQGNEKNR